jgi:arylsulfatase A-like enzyme
MDVAPTILALAGASAGVPLDGHPLLPAEEQADHVRRAVLLMSEIEVRHPTKQQLQQSSGDSKTAWKYRGVVTKRWKLIRWVEHRSWELYDMRRDPDELRNLSERQRWDAVQARLMKRLELLWGCAGRECDG